MNLYAAFLTRYRLATVLLLCLVIGPLGITTAGATIVRYQTVMGDIDVRLYDAATPASVANFMNYLNDGDWTNTYIHRSVPGFVVQGGANRYESGVGIVPVSTDNPVVNEPGISNLRGTLAYAKQDGEPDSATSQWFFNLSDANTFLDSSNGGFTVFGRVLGNGIEIVDAIDALPSFGIIYVDENGDPTEFDMFGNPVVHFQDLPRVNWNPGEPITLSNLVYVNTITQLNFDDADYNFDGTVDAADYTVWRDTFGSTTQAEADGNGNGIVDQADYDLWLTSFGNTSNSNSSSVTVPEPATLMLLLSGMAASKLRRRS